MTDLQNLSFPLEYYCDEVREGFFVSEAMKRFWAAQLVVLAEIDKICKKHNINWYADSGTLLGAVRHKGYIPWDDDLDIAMFRDDYNKFLTYAREELPKGYLILSSSDGKTDNPFGRIVNGKEVRYQADHLSKFCGCPFLVGVDIFQFDKIYRDIKKEEDRMKRGHLVLSTICGIRDHLITDDELEEQIKKIEEINNITIDKSDTTRSLIKLFERIAQESNGDRSNEIAIMDTWIGENKGLHFRSNYDKCIELTFETTVLRAPYKYREVLKGSFGDDYMTPIRGGAAHGYPLYREQENEYRKCAGMDPGRYYFIKDSFVPKGDKVSFLTKQKEMLMSLQAAHNNILDIVAIHGIEAAIPFLETCQKAAVAIGNIIEGKYGEGTGAVTALEKYCEAVHEASVGWNDDSKNKMDDALKAAEEQIDELGRTSPKEILFMLCRASWWDSIKDVYNKAAGNEDNHVSVMPVPFSFLDNIGNIVDIHTELEAFEKIPELEGRITNLADYNIEGKHPDVIVIQFPYDECSRILVIPEQVYSDKLSEYTDKMVFVPFLEPDAPESTEDVAYAAMQELVEQPAVFNADRILIGSEKLREYYVKKLVDMTDESLKEYWDNRIGLKSEEL